MNPGYHQATAMTCAVMLTCVGAGCARSASPVQIDLFAPVTLHLVTETEYRSAIPMDDGFRVLTVDTTSLIAVADGAPIRVFSMPFETSPIGDFERGVQRVELLGSHSPVFLLANRISFDERRFRPGERLVIGGFDGEGRPDCPRTFLELPQVLVNANLVRFDPGPSGEFDSSILLLEVPVGRDYTAFVGGPVAKPAADGVIEIVALVAGVEKQAGGTTTIRAITIPGGLRDLYRAKW